MKIGFDLHGVLDHPRMGEGLCGLTRQLVNAGTEVHILTGHEWNAELERDLAVRRVWFTHFFSITDHYADAIRRDAQQRPWLPEAVWDAAKGLYAAQQGLDLHFDDSDRYGLYFTTPYCRIMPV